jgi:hypothetical protein
MSFVSDGADSLGTSAAADAGLAAEALAEGGAVALGAGATGAGAVKAGAGAVSWAVGLGGGKRNCHNTKTPRESRAARKSLLLSKI